MAHKIKILSAVPTQLFQTEAKLRWIEHTLRTYKCDILVPPQEFFGGAYIMPENKHFMFSEIIPQIQSLSEHFNSAIILGYCEKLAPGHNREAIAFIDRGGIYRGSLYKLALPRYDYIGIGYGELEPETFWEARFKTFEICGAQVSAIFCWEVYSNILWTGLSLLKPDLIFSLIKFGPNSWPKLEKNKLGLFEIVDFGYGILKDDTWIDRLYVANKYQVKCPIICSTNSWNIKPVSAPLCGTISLIPGQAQHSLWYPMFQDQHVKEIPEKIIVDEIDIDAVRSVKRSRFEYKELVGEWPPYDLARFNMLLKIDRLETRLRNGRETLRSVRGQGLQPASKKRAKTLI